MKVPQCCKLSVAMIEFAGEMRPKFFFELKLECQESGMTFSRAVLMHRMGLRIRLWLARINLIRCHKKFKKFAENNGL